MRLATLSTSNTSELGIALGWESDPWLKRLINEAIYPSIPCHEFRAWHWLLLPRCTQVTKTNRIRKNLTKYSVASIHPFIYKLNVPGSSTRVLSSLKCRGTAQTPARWLIPTVFVSRIETGDLSQPDQWLLDVHVVDSWILSCDQSYSQSSATPWQTRSLKSNWQKKATKVKCTRTVSRTKMWLARILKANYRSSEWRCGSWSQSFRIRIIAQEQNSRARNWRSKWSKIESNHSKSESTRKNKIQAQEIWRTIAGSHLESESLHMNRIRAQEVRKAMDENWIRIGSITQGQKAHTRNSRRNWSTMQHEKFALEIRAREIWDTIEATQETP